MYSRISRFGWQRRVLASTLKRTVPGQALTGKRNDLLVAADAKHSTIKVEVYDRVVT
jgi:hypothetical protein